MARVRPPSSASSQEPFETFIMSPDTSDHATRRGRCSSWRSTYLMRRMPRSSSYSTCLSPFPPLIRHARMPGTNFGYDS